MKKIASLVAFFCYVLLLTPAVFAQEHYTEGPVWELNFYKTKQGHFDDYMKYLRTNYLPQSVEQKKQGLILDTKVFLKTSGDADEWDVCVATLYPSYAKALDYSKGDEDKFLAIAGKHWNTLDAKKQQEMSASRFEFRDFVSSDYVREVTLRPMP